MTDIASEEVEEVPEWALFDYHQMRQTWISVRSAFVTFRAKMYRKLILKKKNHRLVVSDGADHGQ